MKITIVNQSLANNLWQAWQNEISRAHGRYQIPETWNGFLEKLKNLATATEDYPAIWEFEDDMIAVFARAIDNYFAVGRLRHFDTDDTYLAEADDLNRLYDQIVGRYSRSYKKYLMRGR